MSTRLFSSSVFGIDGRLIEVEADSSPGLHSFTIVGLPDKAVQESKDRIASAIKNSGFSPPNAKHKKIIVNLAPADIKKEGPAYDLPIALSYLVETGQIKFDPSRTLFIGELSLDGTLKHVNGVLAAVILARHLDFKEVVIPRQDCVEASAVSGIEIRGANSIKEVADHLVEIKRIQGFTKNRPKTQKNINFNPFNSILGQGTAKRAISVAVAGFHNILMSGAPGSGKTLLARAVVDMMPPMSEQESLEVAKIYSSVGLLSGDPLSIPRPFRSPHHTTSPPAVVGGGSWPKPGEISLAHRGVLFLDEFPEFPRNVLESLRQPIEEGKITISRASGSIHLPAKFMLVTAMNPCPCGNYGDERVVCICPPLSILRYRKKISGPLLDRIDIQINVPRETLSKNVKNQSSDEIVKNINLARKMQLDRFHGHGLFSNSEINHKNIDQFCVLDGEAEHFLSQAVNSKSLSLRAYHKIKKLARTIADLDGSEIIRENHVAEAVGLRVNDKITSDLV